ncbi:MAG: type II toxin-antitoxin system HicA family toxin [Ktedonobacterales bacterium]
MGGGAAEKEGVAVPRKLRELRRDLRRDGWYIDRQKGSHQTWRHPLLKGARVTLAGADGADAQDYQEDDVRDGVRLAQAARKGQKP